ncbi:MAG TPA: hypothetical protein PLQ97_04695 [Myxococcota bacterium]|nr:hypothetical protein [Myxococcota bacterium]HQK51078.1 hypothetical protein [Myxococcota bacterium]
MSRTIGRVLGVAATVWAFGALAQGGTGTAGTPAVTPPLDRTAELAGSNLRASDLQAMSMEEMTRRADRLVEEMDRAVKDVLGLLSQAVAANDFTRINSVNQTLTMMKGLLRISGQNAISLREAVASRDRAGAEHEFVKLHIARNRILALRDQAQASGGTSGETLFLGSPLVERQFADDLPQADVADGLQEVAIDLMVPPSASPYY